MNKATALLQSGTTMPDVAERVGYDSEASFGRAFKRWVGTSPAAFRRTQASAKRSQ
jgi:AraC-like DNA-binding protein